jgi:hypothetical protein
MTGSCETLPGGETTLPDRVIHQGDIVASFGRESIRLTAEGQ